jgi:hypothetical protein
MNRITYPVIILCFLTFAGCKQEKKLPLFDEDTVPLTPANIKVENLPGAARISYTLQKDPSLLYVRVDFETQGIKRNAIASYYNNSILLEGFGDTQPREVKLYAVSRSEVSSVPVAVTVQPQMPPVTTTFASFEIKEDFGGARMYYKNPDEADLTITIMHKDSAGYWVTDEVLYTKQPAGTFAARKLASKLTTFGAFAKDRWGNYSDTLIQDLTPVFERQFDKTKFKALPLPTDNTTSYSANTRMEKMWDGLSALDGQQYQTATGSGIPTWFTFDMNTTSKLSRFRYNARYDNVTVLWGHGNPRFFELWGRADAPVNGTWDGWTKLMDVQSVKPSGLPVGQTTADDVALAQKGEEFDFPPGLPPVRYIRVRVNETWNKQNFIHIAELTFWGQ